MNKTGRVMTGNRSAVNGMETEKSIKGLVALLTVTYMISYITRINYGAVISEMQTAT